MIKGIEKLPLDAEKKKLVETSEQNYKRFAGIHFQVIAFDKGELVVKVWQNENTANKYLDMQGLIDRAKGVFKDVVPDDTKIHIHPIPFIQDDLKGYTIEGIEKDMEELGLKPKDLVELLDIDKSTISIILNKGRDMTKAQLAMFY